MTEQEESIDRFKAHIEIRDKHTKRFYRSETVEVLQTTEQLTLLEIGKKQYNVIGNIKDIVKTEFVIDDFVQGILTFVFLAICVLGWSQINLIFDISIGLDISYIVVIIALSFASAIFFLGTRKFTVQSITLTLIEKKEDKELWVGM